MVFKWSGMDYLD